MKTQLIKNTALSLAVLAATSAGAAHSLELDNVYVGASVVQAYVDEAGLDDDATGGKIFAGYQINQYFAVEVSHFDFDSIDGGNSSLEVDGFGIGLVASYPFTNRFSAFAKVGAQDWDVTAQGSIANQLTEDSDTDVFYGIGAKYKLTDSISLHAEAERYEIENIDLDVASIGFSFSF